MIKVKLILRNLLKKRSYTILNITGLAVGFACAFAVTAWVKYEFSYDKHLPDSDRIYRLTLETVTSGNRLHFARCWVNWIQQLPGVFPQIEELVRLEPYRHTAVKADENRFYSDKIFATDSNFFKVFGIDLLYGDAEGILNEPHAIVISSSFANKCFGNTNPIGKTILLSGEYETDWTLFTIKGVMKDSPQNSHIHFDAVTSFADPQVAPAWAYVYLLLSKGVSPEEILAGLPAFINKVEKLNDQRVMTPHLQKITDIHLYSNKDREIEPNGNITSIFLFIMIALVLLFVSWINYYNLNKARLLALQKQIHILRITGSDNKLVIIQSLTESFICVALSLILAVILLGLSENFTYSLLRTNLLPGGFKGLISTWPIIITILSTSVFAGSLPVFLYVLRVQKSSSAIKESPIRSGLILSSYGLLMTLQFCLSIVLMVSAITIYKQKELILSHSLGEMRSNILVIKKLNWEIRTKYKVFRDKALQNPLIKNFTASIEEPAGETLDAIQVESSALDEDHKDNQLYFLSVEDNFLDFFNIPLIAGRNFSPYNPDRKGEDYILNETAVKILGWTPEEAIGNPFSINFYTPDVFYGGSVVGVVKDFYFTTLRQEIKPYFLFQKPIFYLCFLVEVDSARSEEAIMGLKTIWEEELPDYPFQYEFIDDLYKSAYRKELTQAKFTTFFSLLAIVIICLGLYSVTSVLIARRTMEIGIRKVNGARITDIMVMLTSDFIKWFGIAFVIACPVAWYAMKLWLQNFAYKTDIEWWIFIAAGIVILSVTLLTVCLKSLRAALRNPVEALRYE